MIITTGARLGPYEIISPLGAGGMGEVWKARDTRLDRSVAIKVLPAEFAENEQLKLRFEREAKTISQLNHPHICTLYDVGDGYLVMELLEGESLADRLTKGPMPTDQVLRYGIQIAEALDKAHRAGIVHRDLKPGNVMITKSGAKLLDFGLAKPQETSVLSGLTSMRTEQRKGLTEEGTIVGTFQYMAPEQIEGGDVDARTDIFALGAVLYEMATGRRAFDGKSKASLIASILATDPPAISTVQPMTPAALERVVIACLQKNPDDRLQSAHDVAQELRWVESATHEVRPPPRRAVTSLPWLIALIATGAAIGLFIRERMRPAAVPPAAARFQINAPAAGTIHSFAISPDGQSIALVAKGADGRQLLWIRKRNATSAVALPKTDNAQYPFWSPDAKYVGFFADAALKKIDVSGGSPQIICATRAGRGGSWNSNGEIILAPGGSTSLSTVSASGGRAAMITKLDPKRGESTHRWPMFLPDGKHFIFLVSTFGSTGQKERFGIYLSSLGSNDEKFLVRADSNAAYANGYLFFARQSTLYAVRFDAATLQVQGDPIPVTDDLRTWQQTLWSEFAVSDDLLLYQLGSITAGVKLAWFDRSGARSNAIAPPGYVANPRISPDGLTVAFDATDTNTINADILLLGKGRTAVRRLTFDLGPETQPIWSPDGRWIYYFSWNPQRSIGRIAVDGRSRPTDVLPDAIGFPMDITSDGKNLLFMNYSAERQYDIELVPIDRPGAGVKVVASQANETDARISPDGSMLAYTSNESGRPEIYLTTFPGGVGKWQVSNDGGSEPRWRRDGHEIFYLDLQKRVVSAGVRLTNPPELDPPVPLFRADVRDAISGNDTWAYDVSADGKAFVLNVTDPVQNDVMSAVLNWRSELKQ